MKHMTANAARRDFDKLLSSVTESSEPVTVVDDDERAIVVMSVDEWESIQETLQLQSIPDYK
jgi:prevent-host-death family protein